MEKYEPQLINGKIIDYDGSEVWYKDSQFHREDGPAITWKDGSKHWFFNGKTHRIGGPAIHNDDLTYIKWFIDSTEYKFDDYCRKLSLDEEEIFILRLKWNVF